MNKVTATISKASVFNEVAKITAYIGAKSISEKENAYDAVFTTDEDRYMIEDFWQEAVSLLTLSLSRYIEKATEHIPGNNVDFITENFEVTFNVTDRFEESNVPVIKTQIFYYFVYMIVGKWLEFSDYERSQIYIKKVEDFAAAIQIALRKKKRP